MGNYTTLTETLIAVQNLPSGTFLESDGQVVAEAENFTQNVAGLTRNWLTATAQSGYTGTAYLQPLPDNDVLYQTGEITNSPQVAYPVNFTTPGTYTVWLRGYASNAAGDSAYVGLGSQLVGLTGFAPGQWSWARLTTSGLTATLTVTTTGLYTSNVWMREDGLRIDRLLLTTDTTYIPTGFGPAESARLLASSPLTTPLTHTIVYTYDNLYRLTNANYNTGDAYTYSYDPVGNRLQQIINGNTTSYQYDAANRLAAINGQSNVFDSNGNLLQTGALTNTFDAANRLISTQRVTTTLQPIYNGVGDRVGQTVGATTTNFTLDIQGLPEVINTSAGNSYLHLPGVIMTENNTNEVRYLLSDGLGSVRQAIDETGAVVAYNEFDPYGNPVQNGSNPYAYTGEWWQSEVGLLHLRARWYAPQNGIFLSKDAWEGDNFRPQTLNGWNYVQGNPVNYADPSGYHGCVGYAPPAYEVPLADSCDQGSGGAVIVGLGALLYNGLIRPLVGDAAEEMADIANEAWDNWQPEPEKKPTPPPFPWSGPTPEPPNTCTPTPTPDPNSRRLVELGTGYERIPGTMAFEILYNEYEDDFDEFVSVDKLGQIELLKMQGRLPDSSHIYEIKTTEEVPNNFANFLFAMSPGPMSLAPEIVRHASRIQKSNATVWFILDRDTYGPYPYIIKYLEQENFTIIRHDKGDKLSEKNILKLPFQSAWIPPGSEWIEAYKGPGIP